MSVSPARRIAFDVLLRVERHAAFASDLLHARLGKKIKPADAAIATELTLGVLRWKRLLDFLLERAGNIPVEKLDLEVATALRMGLYQLRFLTRIPPRAAIHESVELVKHARKRSAAGLVNAVLRKAAADARVHLEEFVPQEFPLPKRLGIIHSHPTWLVERWLACFGEERTIALLESNNRRPETVCAIQDLSNREEAVQSLRRAGFRVEPGRWLRTAPRVQAGPASPPLTQTEAFRRGWISIQDEASQMIPLLLGVAAGHSVLDLCAAPGGKTAALARAAGRSALVLAADLHIHRLRSMRAQLKRLGIEGVALVALDATRALPFGAQFDRILVDAPCSGTGTLARNPEIRWRLRPEDLADFHRRQMAILLNALDALALGGRLVYATCSLEPEENEAVVREALAACGGCARVSAPSSLAPRLMQNAVCEALFDAGGDFRTLPPEHGTDGFFAAAIARQ